MKLTQRAIDNLICEPGRRDRLVFDDVQRGLAVRVTAGGGKSFLAQYVIGGQKRRVPLGACNAVALADAREAVKAIMGDVAMGLDPAAARKEQASAARARADKEQLTLAVLVETWRTLHLAHRRERYAVEAVRALRIGFARHWERPAEDLDRAMVVNTLDGLVRGGSVAMAARTAAYGRACYSWAVKRGTVKGNPFADLPSVGMVPKRDRVLTDDECVALWRAAVGAPYGALVRFLLLTGQRREEVAGMTWAELDEDLSVWTIPGDRTKNGALHVVPLTEPARDILRSLRRWSDTAFAGDTGGPFRGWSKAKVRLDAASGVSGWRLHDLRRTLATGLQRLGVRLEVTEAVLNHVSGSRAGIVGIYQRHDWAAEKRAALDAWSAHLMAALEGREPAGNVVALPQRTG
ncbi:MAG: tyrosine-type recombinase/integrase [Alphaproteobacteria bacterium]